MDKKLERLRQGNDAIRRYLHQQQSAVGDEVDEHDDGGEHIEPLTWRELETLRLMAEGMSAAQIAERIGIARRSVEAHQEVTYRKLRVKNRMQAIRVGFQRGLLR